MIIAPHFMLYMIHSYVTWLIHVWRDWFPYDMAHPAAAHTRQTTRTCTHFMQHMIHFYVTWHIHVRHDSFVCAMTHSYVTHLVQQQHTRRRWRAWRRTDCGTWRCVTNSKSSHNYTVSLAYTHTNTHTFDHTNTHSLYYTDTHTLYYTNTHGLDHTHQHTHSLTHTQTHILYHTHTHVIGRKYFPNKGNVFLKGIFLKKENIFLQFLKVWLGISRTSADSQLNPVYMAFHRICCWGNKTIRR